jgi:hypothetical protein
MDQLHHRGRVNEQRQAQRRRTIICAIILGLAPISTSAEPWMEDGKTCFCLKHPTVGVLRGCTGTRFGGDTYVTARCSGGEAGDKVTKIKVEPPWGPIKDGEDACTPCALKRASVKEVPRGEGE